MKMDHYDSYNRKEPVGNEIAGTETDIEETDKDETAKREREARICLWFDMWLLQQDLGIDDIFTTDVTYIESWGPKYENRETVKHWFLEWNTRGKVLIWDIRQFFHKENQTITEWYFKNQMKNGAVEEFDGMTLVEWSSDNKIRFLKEFGCSRNQYNPYQNGEHPKFREEAANWF